MNKNRVYAAFLGMVLPFFIFTGSGMRGNGIGGHFSLADNSSPLKSILSGSMVFTGDGPTFNNVVLTITLPPQLTYERTVGVDDGSVSVSGQTITWTTGTASSKNYSFELIALQAGTYTLTAYVTDNQGTLHPYVSDTVTVVIPTVNNGVYTTPKNQPLTINLADLVVTTSFNSATARVMIDPSTLNGVVSPLANNVSPFTVTYTPQEDFVGYDFFTVQAIDALGNESIGSVFIAVGVEGNASTDYVTFLRTIYNPTPSNKSPVATSFVKYIVQNATFTADLRQWVYVNNAMPPVSYSPHSFNSTVNAVVSLNDYNFEYSNPTLLGTDTFFYTITDELGRSSTGIIVINVVVPEVLPAQTLQRYNIPD
jgi:hypothetical protein